MNEQKPKLKAGRKSKLTRELISQFEAALQGHSSIKASCDMLGISQETFFRWKREGEEAPSGMKREFYETIKRAQGMSRIVLTNKIAADPSWQAKAWLLERLYPQEFGRRQLIAHAGADGQSDLPTATTPVQVVIKMQGTDGQPAPWTYAETQDPDPENGSDPWEQEQQEWAETVTPDPAPVAKTNPEAKTLTGWPQGVIDTGGKPRDPDAEP